jgi:deoxyribodipyrimidine photo-lyase
MLDNKVFSSINSSNSAPDTFSAIAFLPNTHQRSNRYQMHDIGVKRQHALCDAINYLAKQYERIGSKLQVSDKASDEVIESILNQQPITHVIRTRQCGIDERRSWQILKSKYPNIEFIEVDNHSLFALKAMAPLLEYWPTSFSQYRNKLPNFQYELTTEVSESLPPPLNLNLEHQCLEALTNVGSLGPEKWNESTALSHVTEYFKTDYPKTYKETRNALMGSNNHTGLSVFLSLGVISVKQVVRHIEEYEAFHGKSSGTEWIYFELLWREYFFWMSHLYKDKLFAFTGISNKRPLLTFYADRFNAWCNGMTKWPIVNACMRELNETGLLSNRGRQIVASALVNELGVDWRYGAAYFQQQLLDYEVGSNWGNWQYIAGVGSDPRGGRHFDLQKQTELFDADGSYRARWLADSAATEFDVDTLDPSGWPIEHNDVHN